MRRTPLMALPCLVLSAALALAGCSGSGDAAASATASSTAQVTAGVDCSAEAIETDSAALPQVAGDPGTQPSLTWTGQAAPEALTVKTLTEGTGATIEQQSDVVAVSYSGWQWDGTEPFDSSYSGGRPAAFALNAVIPGWTCGLMGHAAGDRLLMSIPADMAYGDDASTDRPTGTLVFVVEVTEVFNSESVAAATAGAMMEGEQALADRGIALSGDLGAAPTISVNAGAAEPTAVEVIVVARGTGTPVAADSTLITHMAYIPWDDSEMQSSWELGEVQPLDMTQATGMEGLVGVPAGSRVVLLQPANPATGSSAAAWVMDIAAVL
ncbi:MAG: FKBP-type peptidyl-prolyl cis-trans isomerase [Actinomyces sp.]|uniref:FKBP-type peptidyl-prolyl cis-trans isomerase n=1 Tax=Actinomyces sp. TaxID=29317 RepID=UPI0026DC12E7|nr:FKBP-type peptidyl-prolyl cis-trans isomerase [Actinomyces sp.]MDO4243056.1 FKBP-type peptidyl-prolyl cis-trans isomerase [Actinomyces sp.]